VKPSVSQFNLRGRKWNTNVSSEFVPAGVDFGDWAPPNTYSNK